MAETGYDNNGYDGERYEIYNFNATEDDYIVSDILLNFEAFIHNFNSTNNSSQPEPITCSFELSNSYEPTWSIKATNLREPLWHNKRKRSALDSPPSPPRIHHAPPPVETKNEGNKFESKVYSPSSPLSYEPNELHNNNNNIQSKHQLKNKSKKMKLKDWEEHIQELEQTKQQLTLSLDNVKSYHQKLLDLNTRLRAKRDEKNGELMRKNPPLQVSKGFNLNLNTGQHQFPIFGRQQQEQECTYQQGGGLTLQYYPFPFSQDNNDKILQAAEARYRRKIKINTKRNSNALRIKKLN